ncbi:OmpA family protein [Hymenobacter sp. M29]|uniref:OmpA family protein n=1 Tax=Hymenobacter mellowenesis TaxID=3063995 RepID=A0ABT9AHP6_9BACT|nr:OmpA family protein [Hymenobacter sp. M29]MDO7848854.1 OmpA family protein [Hymenobacter sp. M29]
MKLRFLSLVVLQVVCAAAVQAQVATMSLMGNVQSVDRQALPGAAVTVIHVPSGVRHAAASDRAGRFQIPNLMVGGPYLIRVGEGGYQPQTVENIFLEAGKTASFTVTLNKLSNEYGKNRNNRNAISTPDPNGTTMTLAPEAVVGGPVLVTLTPNQSQRGGGSGMAYPASAPVASAAPMAAPAPTGRVSGAMPSTAPVSSAAPAPVNAPRAAVRPAAAPTGTTVAPVAAPVAPVTPVASETARPTAAPRYSRRPYTPGRPYSPGRPYTPKKVTDPIVPGHFDAKSGNYLYHTGTPTTLKLANGTSIAGVGVNSTENYLHRFLADPAAKVDTLDLTQGWYNFDHVFFNPGKATLTPESMGQLRNIAAILKAYPNARIKLGGYTDSTGTYKVNRQLSEARARTAWASLVEMGISPSRIDARGYGPNYSIAPNNTETGRAMNRRLSVKVLQK